jgi:hypothetical protein
MGFRVLAERQIGLADSPVTNSQTSEWSAGWMTGSLHCLSRASCRVMLAGVGLITALS